jgi:uracil-DNA glycosylase
MSLPPPQLEESWKRVLYDEWKESYLKDLANFIAKERASSIPIFPSRQDVFRAFQSTPYPQTKVVIIGQDPYHGPGQAHGLSFSVPSGIAMPPSLKNIFKELEADLGLPLPTHGNLQSWAKQGVLLLNAVLTVRIHQPGSHQGMGWERFTDAVVKTLCQREDPVIFVLWGKTAQEKCKHILQETRTRHYVLTASHPSPYSAYSGFFGCRHFSKINDLLKRQSKEPLDWKL